jgi:hypothetical protein|tara:strand:- start:2165 stop:2572 length:408 start_codon:yes stop_codon:yes gene_type:complete
MATNYLSASLLSPGYQTLLDADNREREKELQRAFENAHLNKNDVNSNNLLRDDNGVLLSYSDEENNSTAEYFQQVRIESYNNSIEKHLIPSVLKEKRKFTEFKATDPPPTEDDIVALEKLLKEKIRAYDALLGND